MEAVVVDNGSGSCKSGWAGEKKPSKEISTIVGVSKKKTEKEYFIGKSKTDEELQIKRPLEREYIENFDLMEKIWHHIFYNELKVSPEDHPIVLTEAPMDKKSNRYKTAEIMFEVFSVPAMILKNQASLSLMASGRCTGLVISSGEELTYTIPNYESYILPQGFLKLDIAGREITHQLTKLVSEKGFNLMSRSDFDFMNHLKEDDCYVALDYNEEMNSSFQTMKPNSFKLPDGNVVSLKDQRFKCTEILFQPHLFSSESMGLDQMVYNSIMKCDICIRKEFYANVVLSGGTTLFSGFPSRLKKGINDRSPDFTFVKIFAPDNRKYLSWIGGSILGSSSDKEHWISKQGKKK